MAGPSAACVFVSVCCPHFADKRDLLLGVADELAARRVRTTLVLAGHTPCSHIIRLDGDRSACAHWFEALKVRANQTGAVSVEVVGARPEIELELETLWARIANNQRRAALGHRLGLICEASVVRHDLGGLATATGAALAAEYEKDTLRHLLAYRDIVRRHRPAVAAYFGGQFHQDRTAFLACREAGVLTWALESAFVPGFVYFDRGGCTGSRGTLASRSPLQESESRVPSIGELAAVEELMARSFHVPQLPPVEAERQRVRREFQVHADERVVLFLGQVGYDASLTTDGGDFRDQYSTLAAMDAAVSPIPRATLIVRPHPKSAGRQDGITRAAAEMGIAVVHDDEAPLLQSLLAADVVVTVSSQAGLQAAWLGRPVITLGHAFYGGKGFTIDAGGRSELLSPCLLAALTDPRRADRAVVDTFVLALRREMVDRPDASELVGRMLAVSGDGA